MVDLLLNVTGFFLLCCWQTFMAVVILYNLAATRYVLFTDRSDDAVLSLLFTYFMSFAPIFAWLYSVAKEYDRSPAGALFYLSPFVVACAVILAIYVRKRPEIDFSEPPL